MSRLFRSLVKKIKPLVFFFFYFIGLSFHSSAQSCPSIKRNNGNNAAHTDYALSVMNTAFTNVPSSAKEGTITVDFGSSMSASAVPVIEGVYIGGSRLNVDFGPPSEINNVGPKYNVEYCFYGSNLPPAKSFTVRFLNPSDSSVWSECTFPELSGSDANTINVSSDIADNAVCAGESITWTATATAANGQSLRYKWYKDGSELSGKTNASLTVSNFGSSDAGTYYCIVEEFRNNTINWSFQTPAGTLSLSNCANLEITRIQSPDEISISGSNDLSVAFDVEFNQDVNTPATTDFSAILDLSSSRTISSISSFGGSSKRYIVVVDILDEDEGQLALAVASSNSISSSSGSLNLSSTTPTITNNNSFSIGADGVAPAVESAVAGGDRNGDGVPDRNQKNVSTFPWRSESKFNQGAAASTNDFVTLSIGDVSNSSSKNLDKNLKISTLGVIGISDSYFSGVSFPSTATIGGTSQNVNAIYDPIFFKIEANGNSFSARDVDNTRAGTQIRLYFDMPDGGQNFDTYMKWNGVDEQWYEFKADGNLATYDDGAEFIDSDGDGDYDRVVLTITEGAKTGGDADGQSDNIIIDPGTIVSTAGLSYTGALSFEVVEGNTPVATLSTSGATTWAITPVTGYDNSLFSIDASTGALSFTSAPDFENPQDVFGTAGDNVHMVRVTISDGSGNSTLIDIEVTVLNAWEKDSDGCPSLSDISPSTGAGTLFDRYAGNYTQYPTLPGGYTGYFLFTFPTTMSEYGIPFIDKIFADGVEISTGRFDNPRIDDGGNKAYSTTGIVQYPYYGGPSDNIWSQATIQVFFTDGTSYSNRDDLCSYSMSSPYNQITMLDVTENFTSAYSVCGGSGSISVAVNNADATNSALGPNGGTLLYQWQEDVSGTWTDITGATTASYAITSTAQNGTYRCIVRELISGTDYYDVYYTSSTAVTVVAAPTISLATLTLCESATGNLSATTTNNTGETWVTSDVGVATVLSTGFGAATVSGVSAGTATITYTDGNGCSTTTTVTVNALPTTTITSSDVDNIICDGESITLTSDQSGSGYTYKWFKDGSVIPGETSSSYLATVSGSYTLEVTNSSTGCIATTPGANAIAVVENSNPVIALSSSTNVACFGESTGAINISVSGGDGNFTFAWSDGASYSATSEDIINVFPGAYSVTVTDGNSCSANTSYNITQPASALSATTSSTNVSSSGGSDGSATVTPSGGTAGYTYLWSDGQTNATATNLSAGNYSVVIKDANLCSITKNFTVTEPSSLSATATAINNVSCNNGSDGSASVSVTGGTSPYTYSWNTSPIQTNSTATNLAAGTYTVTITDFTNVVTTANVTISEPSALSLSITATDVSCVDDVTGALDATVTGGTPNYTFAWSNSSSSEDQTGLGTGTYSLTVTDDNGCQISSSATISVLDNIAPTVTTQDITVQMDALGSATITAAMINDGSTDNCAISSLSLDITSFDCDDLGPNTVVLNVTDNNGNSATGTATVTVVDNIDPTITAPAAVTVNVDAGACSTALSNVTLGTPTTGDNCSVATTTNDAPVSFPLGATTVTWTVTDGSGNTATSTQVVTVVDNIDPTITAPAAVTVNVDAGACSTALSNVTLGTPTTGDNCSVATTTNDAPVSFPLGATTVTWTVTDGSGNTATSTQVVTVVDNIDPTITAPAAVTVNVDAGACSTALSNVTLGTPTTGDNCSVATTTNDAPVSFPLGATTVTWTVTDGSGNTATSTQVVTVVDNIDPTITAPAAVTVNVDAGACSTALSNVTLGTPTTGDNCSVATTTNDAPVSFPLGATTVTWTVTDGSGNTATSTQVVTVVDNIDPTITAPAAVTVNVDAGACSTALSNVTLGTPTTGDNCSVATTTNDAPVSFPLGATTVTWTVTDGSGNTATSTQVVTVVDNIDPTITAPAAVTVNVDAGACSTALSNVTLGTPTTGDNCSVATTTNDAPVSFPLGATTVTWTVTDGSGNTATSTQVVTVVDNIDPTITAPAAVTVNVDAGACSTALSNVTLGTPTTGDNCSVATTTNDAPVSFPLGATTVTWTVTDGSGNTATSTQVVTVEDNIDPVAVAQDITVFLDANGQASITTADVDNGSSDNCTFTLGLDITSFDCTNLGANTVTLTATDGSSNDHSATATVTVVDNTAPVAVAQDITVFLDANGQASITTADVDNGSSDNCTFTLGLDITSFDCTNLGANTVTLTATDGSSNDHSATATVTVVDNIDPVAVAQDITVFLDANGQASITTADVDNGSSDNCTFTLGLDITSFDCTNLGANTVTLTATDGSSNDHSATATVTVVDNIDPVAVAQDITVFLDANGQASITTADVDNGSSDNCTFTLGLDITSFDCTNLGANTVTLTATDGSSNDHSATATVTVVDNIDPVAVAQDITVFLDANGQASITTADVDNGSSDNCTFTLGLDITSFDCTNLGANTVTLTATDGSSNDHSATATVTVVDNIDPVAVAQDITVFLDANGQASITTADVDNGSSDNCTFTLGLDITSFDCTNLGANTVTLTATDGSSNDHSATATVTVVDNIDPTITAPAAVSVNVDAGTCATAASNVTLGTPTTADNCSVASTTNNAPTSFPLGATTVTWTVTDGSGNTTTATQVVTVIDNIDPVLTCPNDLTVYGVADSTLTSVSWSAATATDNCSIDTIYSDIQTGHYFPLGVTTVTYVAIDGSGNSDTCSFSITVVDTVSPVITGCPSAITQNNDTDSCGAVVNWAAPTYYDNSDYYTVSASHASGDYFPVGTTTVTITVADSSGNSSVCAFDVTVEDAQVPYVVPFSNVAVTLGTDGMYNLAVATVDSASYDNCGIANRYLSDTFFNCNDVPAATTWLVLEDVHGNKDSALVNIQVSLPSTPVLTTVATVSDVLCHGDSTGFIQVAVSGGVAPYAYNWSSGSNVFEAINLPIGSYWFEVTDTNGCYTSDTLVMNEPAPLAVSTVKSIYPGGYNVSINGTSDGSITTTASGGITPYTFDWNTGAFTTQDLTGISAGIYSLVMTDSNGCTITVVDTLTEPTPLVITASSLQSVVCPDDTTGIALAVASGAVPPYQLTWDFGSTVDYVTGLSYGIYTVTATDTNGAVATDTVLIDALDYDCDGIYNVDEGGSPNGGGGLGDVDGDGIPNQEDEDSDGDGLPDDQEFDYDNDGVGFDDCDGDGIPNFLDPDLCELLVPAVFTPNDDGDNDYWEILGIMAFPDNNVKIFNRWGELVYSKEGYNNEFNGRANTRTQMNGGDGLLPTGTYYYVVKVYETGDIYTGYVYITK